MCQGTRLLLKWTSLLWNFPQEKPDSIASELGGGGQAMASVLSMVKSEEVLWTHTREALSFLGGPCCCVTVKSAELQGKRRLQFYFFVLSGSPVRVS